VEAAELEERANGTAGSKHQAWLDTQKQQQRDHDHGADRREDQEKDPQKEGMGADSHRLRL